MALLMQPESTTLTQFTERKVQDMQSSIATIEISVYLLSNDIQHEQIATVRAALHRIREISKQFLVRCAYEKCEEATQVNSN